MVDAAGLEGGLAKVRVLLGVDGDTGFEGLPMPPDGDAVDDLAAWLALNRAVVAAAIAATGVLLVRGAGLRSAEEFERLCQSLRPDLLAYTEGNSPRTKVGNRVYTSTDLPPDQAISLHNELSYAHWWPEVLFFGCLNPADNGGETLLADGAAVLEAVRPETVERFEEHGLLYVQNLPKGRGLGKSWPDAFDTTDQAQIEAYLTKGGVDFCWRPDGGLQTRQVRQATTTHEPTGTRVWFNQAEQWHPSYLGEDTEQALVKLLGVDNLPHNCLLGNNEALRREELEDVRRALASSASAIAWERGDFLVIDNVRIAHGRTPFRGDRRVVVAMA